MALETNMDIINAAFARIGEDPIEGLEDDEEGSLAPSLIYEETVEFNLGLLPSGFTFGREIRQLSRIDGAAPLTGYAYVFDVPGQTIGLPVFLTDDPTDPNVRFTRFILTNSQVHSDADPLFAMCKFRPDPHLWTATFKTATITAIAARLAFAIASDRNTKEELLREAYGSPVENYRGGMMRTALAEDGFSNPPRKAKVFNNPLENAWRS
jgi:hypothetical protein